VNIDAAYLKGNRNYEGLWTVNNQGAASRKLEEKARSKSCLLRCVLSRRGEIDPKGFFDHLMLRVMGIFFLRGMRKRNRCGFLLQYYR